MHIGALFNEQIIKEENSLKPVLPGRSPGTVVVNTSNVNDLNIINVSPHWSTVKTERLAARVVRNNSNVENQRSRKETKTNDTADPVSNTSRQQTRPYASQNQINLEPQNCSYHFQTERSRFSTQKSVPLAVSTSKILKSGNTPHPSKKLNNKLPETQVSDAVKQKSDHVTNSYSRTNGSSNLVTHNNTQDSQILSNLCKTSYVHYFSNPELNVVNSNRSREEGHLMQLLKYKDEEVRKKLEAKERVILQTVDIRDQDYQAKSIEKQAVLEKRLADLVTASIRRDEMFKRQLTLAQKEITRLQAKLLFEISEKEAIEAKYRETKISKTKLERALIDSNNFIKQSSLVALNEPVVHDQHMFVSSDVNKSAGVSESSNTVLSKIKLSSETATVNGVILNEQNKNDRYANKDSHNESVTFSSSYNVSTSKKELVNNNPNVHSNGVVNQFNLHSQDSPVSTTIQPPCNYACESLTFPEIQPVYAKMENSSELFYFNSIEVDTCVETNNILTLTVNSIDNSTDLDNHCVDDAAVLTPSSRQCMQKFNASNTNVDFIQSDNDSDSVSCTILPSQTSAQTSNAAELFPFGFNIMETGEEGEDKVIVASEQINKLVEEVTKARSALEACRREFDQERKAWLDEKTKVVNYHVRLEEQLSRVQKQNKRLEDELSRLGRNGKRDVGISEIQ